MFFLHQTPVVKMVHIPARQYFSLLPAPVGDLVFIM